MNNSDVYNLQPKTIQELINEASQGAICIPNIQRPYVWEPHQLANLVDSLMHGWPCGNLLFWKVSPEQKFFGARRFTKEIRSKECDDVSTPSEDTDNLQYTALVLDGQQRIQSLVIAFAKDSAGFTATPKEWQADVGGSGGKNRHCARFYDLAHRRKVRKESLAGGFSQFSGIRVHVTYRAVCNDWR